MSFIELRMLDIALDVARSQVSEVNPVQQQQQQLHHHHQQQQQLQHLQQLEHHHQQQQQQLLLQQQQQQQQQLYLTRLQQELAMREGNLQQLCFAVTRRVSEAATLLSLLSLQQVSE